MPATPPERDPRAFFYESFAEEWDARMDRNEIEKRLRLVFSRLLRREDVRGKRVLDAGAGMGYFSRVLAEWGARLVALDMGPALLGKVLQKCPAQAVSPCTSDFRSAHHSRRAARSTDRCNHTADRAGPLPE